MRYLILCCSILHSCFVKSSDFSDSFRSLGFSGFFRLSGLYLIHWAYLNNLIWTAGRPSLKICYLTTWLFEQSCHFEETGPPVLWISEQKEYSDNLRYYCLSLEILEAFQALEALQTLQPFRAFPVFQTSSVAWTIFSYHLLYKFLPSFSPVCVLPIMFFRLFVTWIISMLIYVIMCCPWFSITVDSFVSIFIFIFIFVFNFIVLYCCFRSWIGFWATTLVTVWYFLPHHIFSTVFLLVASWFPTCPIFHPIFFWIMFFFQNGIIISFIWVLSILSN